MPVCIRVCIAGKDRSRGFKPVYRARRFRSGRVGAGSGHVGISPARIRESHTRGAVLRVVCLSTSEESRGAARREQKPGTRESAEALSSGSLSAVSKASDRRPVEFPSLVTQDRARGIFFFTRASSGNEGRLGIFRGSGSRTFEETWSPAETDRPADRAGSGRRRNYFSPRKILGRASPRADHGPLAAERTQ